MKIIDEIDGMVHISDLTWDENPEKILSTFSKGQNIKVKILEIDSEKERISLCIKQLSESPLEKLKKNYSINSLVTGEIISTTEDGLNVKLEDGYFVIEYDNNIRKIPMNKLLNVKIYGKPNVYNVDKSIMLDFK